MRFSTLASTALVALAAVAGTTLGAPASSPPAPQRRQPAGNVVEELGRRSVAGGLRARQGDGKIRGVNLGGWFVIECWMTPYLCQPYNAVDQWTLMTAMGNTTSTLQTLQNHWNTWITETDFQQIAAAGLNTVRIPIGHWTLNGSSSEPYIAYAEQSYVGNALLWAKKYNLNVVVDVHTAPNSVNGFDSGGRQGPINFMKVTPQQNVDRLISSLASIVKLWVNPRKYQGIIDAIEVVNEPVMYTADLTQSFMIDVYTRAYTAIRGAVRSGLTPPPVMFHDGFLSPMADNWGAAASSVPAGTYYMDTHRYQAFPPISSNTPDQQISYACGLATELGAMTARGVPFVVGEWSLSWGCTTCTFATMQQSVQAQNNATMNLWMRRFFEAQAATYEANSGGWIFWAWKTSTYSEWSYKDARAQGWIPAIASTKVFTNVNGCPTGPLLPGVNVTFATQSADSSTTTTTNTTINTTASATTIKRASDVKIGRASRKQLQDAIQRTDSPIDVQLDGTNTTVTVNVYPTVKRLTLAKGPSH